MNALSRLSAAAVITVAAACSDSSGPSRPGPLAELSIISGAGQSGRVGSELPGEIVVRAVDSSGRPVPGVALSFEVVAGGGSVVTATAQTNDAGEGRTRWLLGSSAAAEQRLRIRATGSGGSVVEAIVTATAQPGPLASLVAVAGQGQSGITGVTLPQDLVVQAMDSHGNVVAGQLVQFMVESGGGSVSSALVATDVQGRAQARWTLGTEAGSEQSVKALGMPAGNPPIEVRFTATGTAGPPHGVALVSGNGQTGDPGASLGQPLRVRVTDRHGNAVAGVPVIWSAQGGGTVAPASGITDATGHAQAVWTLGLASSQTATAAAAGSQVVFTATLNPPGPLAALTIVEGDAQSGVVGQELPLPLGVRATDAQGRPIVGQFVIFEVTSGGGSVFLRTALTGANGEARDRWTLGTSTSTAQTARARTIDPGTGAAREVTFTATPLAGPVASITVVSGNIQVGPVNDPLPSPLVVRALDAHGNLAPGAAITWTVTAGGGSVNPPTSATGSDGRASTAWTLGPSAAQQVTASAGTSSVLFSATGIITPPGWTFLPDMPEAVRSAGAAVMNGAIHVLGGYAAGYQDAHQVFDIATGTWSSAAPLPRRMDLAMVVVTPAGLHVLGGSIPNGSTRRHSIYDPATDEWTSAPDLPTARRAGVAWYVNGRIYLIGGLVGDNLITTVDIYDVAARTWTTAAQPMPFPRYYSAVALENGEIVVAGGQTLTNAVPTVSAFNPQSGTWRDLEALPYSVSAPAMGLIAGRLCVFGGSQAGRDKVWCRPTGSSSWQDIGTMPRARGEMAYVAVGNSMYLFGGGRFTGYTRFADRVTPFP